MPAHSAQVSCGGVEVPVWLHLEQGCWICCIMPGPSGRIITCTPLPWHVCAQPHAQGHVERCRGTPTSMQHAQHDKPAVRLFVIGTAAYHEPVQ